MVTGLFSSHISRQKEMVDARLAGMKETAAGSETVYLKDYIVRKQAAIPTSF